MPTSEEIAQIEKERASSDANLIKDGAKYVAEDMRLDLTPEQMQAAEKQMRIEKENSPKIKLPKDPDLVKRLQDKLEEYKQRLEKEKKEVDDGYRAPELVIHMLAETNYKIAVLEKLFLEGEVNTYELSRELNSRDKQLNSDAFNNACGVIDDYCTTGGKNTQGGSGF